MVMLTRLSIIKLACFALLLLSAVGGWAQERDSLRLLRQKERYERRVERYERRRENYRSGWEKMIPKYQVLQFAGSIGLVSVGTGWDYGKHKQWETDFLLGIIPRFSSNETKVTLTLRENYMPWRVKLSDSWEFRPFSVSLGMSTVLDDDFWIREPEKYPAPYYKFSTRMRFLLSVGQRFTVYQREDMWFKRISLYYEVGTCDLYLISAFTNKYLKPGDILNISFGIKFQIL